jgi:hypothetical protein
MFNSAMLKPRQWHNGNLPPTIKRGRSEHDYIILLSALVEPHRLDVIVQNVRIERVV